MLLSIIMELFDIVHVLCECTFEYSRLFITLLIVNKYWNDIKCILLRFPFKSMPKGQIMEVGNLHQFLISPFLFDSLLEPVKFMNLAAIVLLDRFLNHTSPRSLLFLLPIGVRKLLVFKWHKTYPPINPWVKIKTKLVAFYS